jgi:hypothetical protein
MRSFASPLTVRTCEHDWQLLEHHRQGLYGNSTTPTPMIAAGIPPESWHQE